MFPDKKWIIYSITEDDFIERERCIERLKGIGLDPMFVESRALKCHECPVSLRCNVTREHVFLGASTC